MATLPHSDVATTAHSSVSSLSSTQDTASSTASSHTPPQLTTDTRPPSQSSDISTTATSSINVQSPSVSSPTPPAVAPSPPVVSLNPTASSGTGTPQNSHKLLGIFVEWRWELFTWAIGTLAMSLILALLCIYKDRSIIEWKSRVQISAVVAIFSQLAQSALIVSVSATIGQAKWSLIQEKRSTIDIERFDEAIRGPEGSMKMLVAAICNPRSPDNKRFRVHLALIAALVTLLMLSFGTFTQQAVAINVRRVEYSHTNRFSSTVNCAMSYRAEDNTPSQVELAQPDGPFATAVRELPRSFLEKGNFGVDTTLSGAVLGGIATSHNLSDVAAQCATSECRWPSYPTLAICSTVEDVSSQFVLQEALPSLDEFVFFPEDINMTLPIPDLYDPEQGNPIFAGPTDFWMATLPAWRKDHENDQPNLIAEVYITYFSACRATNNKPSTPREEELLAARTNLTNWRAFKASFELCIQSLTTSIINGATNTSVLERLDKPPWVTSLANDSIITYSPDDPKISRLPFSVDDVSLLALGDIMRLTLNGSATMRSKSDKIWENSEQIILSQDVYSGDPEVCRPIPNTDIEGFRNRMDNIAVSLTNALRRNPKGQEGVEGSTFVDEQFVDVDLAWLALPIALWVVVTFLLVSSMWRTKRLQLPSWKTSTLPWLECQAADNSLRTRSDMKKAAKSSHIQLKESNSAWHLERTI